MRAQVRKKFVLPLSIIGGALLALAVACGGGGNGDEDARLAAVVQQVLTIGQQEGSRFDMAVGEIIDGFPEDFPVYEDADLVASFRSDNEEVVNYVIVLTSEDSVEEVVRYYEDALSDTGRWQLSGASLSEKNGGVQFEDLDNPDYGGSVLVSVLQDNEKLTNIRISIGTRPPRRDPPPFELGRNLSLPRGFPNNLPLYPGGTVVGTAWLRLEEEDLTSYFVRMLTTDFEEQVMAFYRQQLGSGGWRISDDFQDERGFGLVFVDNFNSNLGGSVSADVFTKDTKYTEVILQVDTQGVPSR